MFVCIKEALVCVNFRICFAEQVRLNQGKLAVSFEPGCSIRRRHLFDLYFWGLQDMSNPRKLQASQMVPLSLILKKYVVVLYYNTQASVARRWTQLAIFNRNNFLVGCYILFDNSP